MKRIITGTILILLLFCHPALSQNVRFGTTFSPIQCEYFDLDWKETYRAILDFPFQVIRLGAYWSEIEKKKGIYDFSRLDWLIQEAANRNIDIVLTVGMKAPRWPEYFIPEWIKKETSLPSGGTISLNPVLQKYTLQFIRQVINRYYSEDAIKFWQVENEALNRFGGKNWRMHKEFLKEEMNLIRIIDPYDKPIVVTASTFLNNFLRVLSKITTSGDPIRDNLEIGDILGINVYPVVGHKGKWWNWYFRSQKESRIKYLEKIINLANQYKKEVWVTELQAEPWEPGHLVYKGSGNPPSSWPEQTQDMLDDMHQIGFRTFFLWGAEYWYYQKKEHQNSQWWEAVQKLLTAPQYKYPFKTETQPN